MLNLALHRHLVRPLTDELKLVQFTIRLATSDVRLRCLLCAKATPFRGVSTFSARMSNPDALWWKGRRVGAEQRFANRSIDARRPKSQGSTLRQPTGF